MGALVSLTPSGRSLPERICGTEARYEFISRWLWPPMTSIIAGPPPLNGTCTTSMPAIIANRTEAVCVKLPTPACANA